MKLSRLWNSIAYVIVPYTITMECIVGSISVSNTILQISPEKCTAQKILATNITELIHGGIVTNLSLLPRHQECFLSFLLALPECMGTRLSCTYANHLLNLNVE